MARGRKPKPDAVKALEGNPGKRRRATDKAPPPSPAECGELVTVGIVSLAVPAPPAELSPEAADEWRRLAGDLVRLGLLRRLDMSAFEARCELYATWRRCNVTIRSQGATYTHKGIVRQRPEIRLAQDCLRQIRQYDSEFGLTPAARARVAHVTGDGPRQGQLPLPDQKGADATSAEASAPIPAPAASLETWTDDEFFHGPAH